MVGTERTWCCVRPLPSSSEDRGDSGAFLLFPSFFRFEDGAEEDRSRGSEKGGAGLEDEGPWGLFKGVFLDQADLLQAAGLRGCTLGTSAGKSSSWKEDFFFV